MDAIWISLEIIMVYLLWRSGFNRILFWIQFVQLLEIVVYEIHPTWFVWSGFDSANMFVEVVSLTFMFEMFWVEFLTEIHLVAKFLHYCGIECAYQFSFGRVFQVRYWVNNFIILALIVYCSKGEKCPTILIPLTRPFKTRLRPLLRLRVSN